MDSSSLVRHLRTFLAGGDQAAFSQWCELHSASIEAATSRGELLKLKHGDRGIARKRLQFLAPCPECSDLPWSFPTASLACRADFYRLLEQLEASTILARSAGSSFVCSSCGADRRVELPEREFGGEIKVVG